MELSSNIIDDRTFKYIEECLEKVKSDMGYIERKSSPESLYNENEITVVKDISRIFFECSRTNLITMRRGRLIKIKDDLYAFEEAWGAGDDGGWIYDFFTKEIDNIEYSMYDFLKDCIFPIDSPLEEENLQYVCGRCLTAKHWLDNEGSLLEKLDCSRRYICSDCVKKSKEVGIEYKLTDWDARLTDWDVILSCDNY